MPPNGVAFLSLHGQTLPQPPFWIWGFSSSKSRWLWYLLLNLQGQQSVFSAGLAVAFWLVRSKQSYFSGAVKMLSAPSGHRQRWAEDLLRSSQGWALQLGPAGLLRSVREERWTPNSGCDSCGLLKSHILLAPLSVTWSFCRCLNGEEIQETLQDIP